MENLLPSPGVTQSGCKSNKATQDQQDQQHKEPYSHSSHPASQPPRWWHNLIESVISINFKSLLMRIDKNKADASSAA